jgi:hypothetical protein
MLHRVSELEYSVPRRICGCRKEQKAGEKGVMRSFITCTHCLYYQGNERKDETGRVRRNALKDLL